jgi:hypothetical protein
MAAPSSLTICMIIVELVELFRGIVDVLCENLSISIIAQILVDDFDDSIWCDKDQFCIEAYHDRFEFI